MAGEGEPPRQGLRSRPFQFKAKEPLIIRRKKSARNGCVRMPTFVFG